MKKGGGLEYEGIEDGKGWEIREEKKGMKQKIKDRNLL